MNMNRFRLRVWDKDEILMHPVAQLIIHENYLCVAVEDFFQHRPLGDDLTLMQCTGLRDSEGKLIWEGDIVEYVDEVREEQVKAIGYITWCGAGLSVEEQKEDTFYCKYEGEQYFNWNELKVIGNIYENPELLEAK